ncbi:MAG: 27-O-demethylrifamycin SV methyltransferase [Ktedonobacteraceae bacterium]
MSSEYESRKKERPSTYFVQDRQNKEELVRVKHQDQMITASMGGVLPEQADPARFRRILDVGCGTGGWIIDAAMAYPHMSLVGIDISSRMVDYARIEAETQHVNDRVEFHVMDALKELSFPDASFDLVNLRLGVSYLRTWDWPRVLGELRRLISPGGVVRLTDNDIIHRSNSPALLKLDEIATCALFRAGHLFVEEGTGLTAHLARLLKQYVGNQVQTRTYALQFQAGTPEGQAYYEDMARVFKTTLPFIQKWGCAPGDYDAIYQQALKEMQKSDFHVTWNYLTAWTIRADSVQ